jgi:hypothetical protein
MTEVNTRSHKYKVQFAMFVHGLEPSVRRQRRIFIQRDPGTFLEFPNPEAARYQTKQSQKRLIQNPSDQVLKDLSVIRISPVFRI